MLTRDFFFARGKGHILGLKYTFTEYVSSSSRGVAGEGVGGCFCFKLSNLVHTFSELVGILLIPKWIEK